MRLHVGTSGFSFAEWKGQFYPSNLPASQMLRFYSERLAAVEINSTFYRMPDAQTLASWSAQVPEGFRFAVKASRRITHQQKLKNSEATLEHLVEMCQALGQKLGPLLFQLPPSFKKDLPCLREFLKATTSCRAAFEFRHASWFDDEVYAALAEAGAALVAGDPDEESSLELPLIATSSWGYLRLRASTYPDALLQGWAERLASQPWAESFVFFKHEVEGPAFATKLREHFGARF